MNITIYSTDQQGTGQFDGGKITEQKPIGFPGEGSVVKRVGPLFYWSWFYAADEGYIPTHPHQGFEIITYVLSGTAEHEDSLGTKSRITSGGAQVMQTGSGAYHSERFIGPDMEGFQIWFEPYLNEAVKRPPVYNEYVHKQLPLVEKDGVALKTVIGDHSPIQLVTDTRMWDVEIKDSYSYTVELKAGCALSVLAVLGSGVFRLDTPEDSGESNPHSFSERDFIVVEFNITGTTGQIVFKGNSGGTIRLIVIETPSKVDYPLYRK